MPQSLSRVLVPAFQAGAICIHYPRPLAWAEELRAVGAEKLAKLSAVVSNPQMRADQRSHPRRTRHVNPNREAKDSRYVGNFLARGAHLGQRWSRSSSLSRHPTDP